MSRTAKHSRAVSLLANNVYGRSSMDSSAVVNRQESVRESVISKGVVYDSSLLDIIQHLTTFVLKTLKKGKSDHINSSWSPRMLGLYSELSSVTKSKPIRPEDLNVHELCTGSVPVLQPLIDMLESGNFGRSKSRQRSKKSKEDSTFLTQSKPKLELEEEKI